MKISQQASQQKRQTVVHLKHSSNLNAEHEKREFTNFKSERRLEWFRIGLKRNQWLGWPDLVGRIVAEPQDPDCNCPISVFVFRLWNRTLYSKSLRQKSFVCHMATVARGVNSETLTGWCYSRVWIVVPVCSQWYLSVPSGGIDIWASH